MAAPAKEPFSGVGYRLGSGDASGGIVSRLQAEGTIRYIRRSLLPTMFRFTPGWITSPLQNHFGKIAIGAGLIGKVYGDFYYSGAAPALSWLLGTGRDPIHEGSGYEKITFAVLTGELVKLGYDLFRSNWLDSAIDAVAVAKLCHIIYTNNQKLVTKK